MSSHLDSDRSTSPAGRHPRTGRSVAVHDAQLGPELDARSTFYLSLQATAGNRAVAALLDPSVHVQRSQAGEKGHGTQEQVGLREAGFSGDMQSGEIGAVYFGNWLRDLSQLVFFPQMQEIINVISLGEFGHPFDPSLLGNYLPSEHLDNPLGAGSAEDPLLQQPAADPKLEAQRQKNLGKKLGELSASQRRWVDEEQTPRFKANIKAKAEASGLPTYIEAGKEHARRELQVAMRRDLPQERRSIALGSALHVVEDNFAHSNFLEVALSELVGADKISPFSPLVISMDPHGIAPLKVGGRDKKGRGPGIVTGTYAGGNEIVSALVAVRTEVLTGALSGAFARGFARLYPKAAPAMEAAGAAMKVGADAIDWVEQRYTAIHNLLTGARQSVRTSVDRGTAGGIDLAGKYAAGEAPVDPETGRRTVTHAQLAKDDDQHPLWAAHMALAEEADRGIGMAIRHYWRSGGDQVKVLGLVDKYISHPAADDWWQPILVKQAGIMPPGWKPPLPPPEFRPEDEHVDAGAPAGGVPGGVPDAGVAAGASDAGVP